jgi:hypothetical protein
MARGQLGELVAVLKAEYGQYIEGMDKSARATAQAADKMEARVQKLSTGIKAGLAGIVGALSVGAITNAFKNVVDQLDVFDELAAKTHLSVEALSEYKYMAGLTSTSLDQVADGHKKLGQVMGEARDGNEKLTATLQRHGVTLEQIKNLDSQAAFRAIADSFSEMDNGVQKTNDSMMLMGKSIGPELIEFLNNGSAGFDRMAQEAAIMGAVIGTDAAVAAGKLNDEMYKLDVQATALGRSILTQLIPPVLQVMSSFNAARIAGEGFWNSLRIGLSSGGVTKEIETLERKLKNNKLYGDAFKGENAALEAKIKALKGATEALENVKAPTLPSVTVPEIPTPTRARAPKATTKIDQEAKAAEAWLKKLQTPLQEYAAKVDEITMLHDKNKLSSADMQGALALAASEFDKAIKSTDEYRDAQAKLAEQQRAQEDLQREIASIYDDTRTPIERLNIELTRLNDLYATGALDLDTYARAQFALEDSLNSHAAEAEKIVTVYDAMGNAVAGWSDQFADALLDANSSFEKFAASITKQLAKIAISAALQPFLRGFGDFISGGISGARATGGPVSAGSAYLVGERGPELFMPGANGKILPNAGGNSVTQNITINGAPNPAELAGWAERIRQSTLRALAVDQARGAGLARARA